MKTIALGVLATVLVLVLVLVWWNRRTPDAFDPDTKQTTLYVCPMWGLANRLRVLRVAYAICEDRGWKLVVVHSPDKGYDAPHLKDLFDVPGIEYQDSIPPNTPLLKFNVENDCMIQTTIADIQASVRNGRVAIKTCGFKSDKKLDGGALMYKKMKPRSEILAACGDVLRVLQNKQNTVGVHIRQGSIPDYQYGQFFGTWDSDKEKGLPTACCHQNRALNKSPCTRHAPVIEKFIKIMKTMSEDTVFFVCSDRPGCIDVLERAFPGRIISNTWVDTSTNDAFGAFCDWWCLSRCQTLICSGMSSFSHEARHMSGARATFVTM